MGQNDKFGGVWKCVLLSVIIQIVLVLLIFFGEIIGQELLEGVGIDDDGFSVPGTHSPFFGLSESLHVLNAQLFHTDHIGLIKI